MQTHRRWSVVLVAIMLVATMLGVALARAAEARVLSQTVRGTQRICAYEVNRKIRSTIVGRGEPCPQNYREPEEQVVSRPPMLAKLKSQAIVDGQRICVYEYLGRPYRRVIGPTEVCTLTPY